MSMEPKEFSKEPEQRHIFPLIIENPGSIVARARATELVDRAILRRDEALNIVEELEAEVAGMVMPRRFSRIAKPSDSPYQLGTLSAGFPGLTQDEHKRQRLLTDLRSIKSTLTESLYRNNIARLIYQLETVVRDIEAAKAEDSPEQNQASAARFHLQGVDVELEQISLVFSPSPHGLFLGENIRVNPGESVIDVGTGSGLFAIVASRLGGKAAATEISREAVEMAKYNALINNAPVDVRHGSFFADFKQKFDVLIGNLPQKLILKERRDPGRFTTKPLGVYGGVSGNEILLDFLKEAKEHMHKDSRLYIQVYSLTDYNTTLQEIDKHYTATPLAKREFIEDEIIARDTDAYMELKNQGVIDISNRDGHWYAYETAYELKLKE